MPSIQALSCYPLMSNFTNKYNYKISKLLIIIKVTDCVMLERQIQINGISVKVKQNLSLSHAGTVWDGALVLAHYFQKNKQISQKYFKDKTILQVGAGTGFLGLACCTFKPEVVYLTDLPEFVNLLEQNIEINKQRFSQTKVQAQEVSWGNSDHISKFKKIDSIIGSQLAYDQKQISLLIQTFRAYKKINPQIKIIISYQKYPTYERNLSRRLQKQFQLGKFREIPEEDMDQDYRDSYIGILQLVS